MYWASYASHLRTATHKKNEAERTKKRNARSRGRGLSEKLSGRGRPMDISKLRAAIKAIVN